MTQTGRRVRIEKLAPTGEGIARTADGVGFIDRGLPGELVETTVYQVRRKFWRGRLRAVLDPSPDRVEGPHDACAGCDWSHFAPSAARVAKRELFLETMQRIGKLEPTLFGELSVAASAPGYRLRTRLHGSGAGPAAAVGYFAPGTHRVVGAERCEAISPATRATLPAIRNAIAESGAEALEVSVLETIEGARRLIRVTGAGEEAQLGNLGERLAEVFEGVRIQSPQDRVVWERGDRSLSLLVGGRSFSVSADTFFQGNRHLVSALFSDLETEAREVRVGDALDAFGGAGLFAAALLSAGLRVVSVESDGRALADARDTRARFADRDRWEIVAARVAECLEGDGRRFACVVADPPRAGLGTELARALARRAERLFVYVSCDPPTLARDLPAIRAEGFEIRRARLYDLFAFTHRVEAMIVLERRE